MKCLAGALFAGFFLILMHLLFRIWLTACLLLFSLSLLLSI